MADDMDDPAVARSAERKAYRNVGSFAGALLYLAASLTAAGLLILTLRNAPTEPRS
jgi:hypothetical protein